MADIDFIDIPAVKTLPSEPSFIELGLLGIRIFCTMSSFIEGHGAS